MARCIFCLQEQEKVGFTDEHVFPAALGGGLVVRNGACGDCNHSFSKFEQPVVEELAPVRNILQIPGRYGKVPQVAATVKVGEKEYDARVKGDGSVQLKPLVTEAIGTDGEREYEHRFLTERRKAALQREAKDKGCQLVESDPGNPVQGEVHIPGNLGLIGSSEGLRTASKIAYVGLAHFAGSKLATSDSFAEVRAYVLEGTAKPAARLFVNERFLEACQQGPHQHSIVMAGRHDNNRVDAIVRLFGGLCYFVVLSEHYKGADFCHTLVYDAYRGEADGILLANEQAEILQTEDVATSPDTIWDDLLTSAERFCSFLEQAIRLKSRPG